MDFPAVVYKDELERRVKSVRHYRVLLRKGWLEDPERERPVKKKAKPRARPSRKRR